MSGPPSSTEDDYWQHQLEQYRAKSTPNTLNSQGHEPMSKEDGGNAFPSPGRDGMSLRDWFAGQALTQLTCMYQGRAVDPNGAAYSAYEFADAMLKARGEA